MKHKFVLATVMGVATFFSTISVAKAIRYKFDASDACWNYGYTREIFLGNDRRQDLEFYTCQGYGQFSPDTPIIVCTSNGCILGDVVKR
jgi:hypothetical protein